MPGVHGAVGVEPFLHCAVVGGDDDRHPRLGGGGDGGARMEVHGFDGPDDGLPVFNVSHHIHIGKVGKDKGIALVADRVHDRRPDLPDGHLRGGIEKGDVLAGRHHNPVFTGEGLLPLAVEEIAHVDRLFRLGDLHLLQTGPGDQGAQGILQSLFGGKGHLHGKVPPVLDHGGVGQPQIRGGGEFGEALFREAPG